MGTDTGSVPADRASVGAKQESPTEESARITSHESRITGSGSRVTRHQSRITIKRLGLVPYQPTWEAMKSFTASRTADTADEIWLLQHAPIYTYGVAGRLEHLPPGDNAIPVLKVDRGGQITYHGPGQLVAYVLLDLQRRGSSVRGLVRALERTVIDLIAEFGIRAATRDGAPGVYVGNAKVAALGLRIRRGCSYHGLSLNASMDLAPFDAIDPCGYPDLKVTQLRDLGVNEPLDALGERLVSKLTAQLSSLHGHES
jgi:lipoyl(octanoyl) transferase